jgi:hypothetical protein
MLPVVTILTAAIRIDRAVTRKTICTKDMKDTLLV